MKIKVVLYSVNMIVMKFGIIKSFIIISMIEFLVHNSASINIDKMNKFKPKI